MRGREFIMKDMYSFDISKEDAIRTYQLVVHAYKRILSQLRLDFAIASGICFPHHSGGCWCSSHPLQLIAATLGVTIHTNSTSWQMLVRTPS